MSGVGMSQWKGHATARADAFGGRVRASKAVLDYVKANGQLSQTTERTLAGRTTNLDRVLQMPYMKTALGVSIERNGDIAFDNGDQAKGLALLQRMLKAMAAADWDVNKIRSKAQREDFIDEFDAHNVRAPDENTGGGASGEKSSAKNKAVKKVAKKAPLPADRKCLALKGKDHALSPQDPRLVELYDEALQIDAGRLPNCASMLTRVFLELSTDHLLIELKVPLPAAHAGKRTSWSDKGIPLDDKIAAALAHLDPTGKARELSQVRQFKDRDAIHAIQALHDFIHSLKANPNPREIKEIWKRWHPYFDRIFQAVL
jgi:hypothetical protein